MNQKSPFIRDDFILDDFLHIENPKFMSTNTFAFYLREILIKTGVRVPTPGKRERKEVSANHGFRKFCHTTMANAKINIKIREMLLGHSIGLSDSYYKPTEREMLDEYLKVVDDLTINDENRLKRENKKLKEKIGLTRNEISELKEVMTVMAKHINFPLDEFNKKFNTDF